MKSHCDETVSSSRNYLNYPLEWSWCIHIFFYHHNYYCLNRPLNVSMFYFEHVFYQTESNLLIGLQHLDTQMKLFESELSLIFPHIYVHCPMNHTAWEVGEAHSTHNINHFGAFHSTCYKRYTTTKLWMNNNNFEYLHFVNIEHI